MYEKLDLDQLVRDFRDVANEVGAFVVSTLPSGIEQAPFTAAIDLLEIVALMRHVRPRVAYLDAERFSAAEYVGLSFENEDSDGRALEHPQVKRLLRSWRYREGQLCRVGIGVVFEGVLHAVVEHKSWVEDFETALSEVAEAVQNEIREKSLEIDHKQRRQIKKQAEMLVTDPRFTHPKASRSKRMYLASTVFADLDEKEIYLIVEEAENMVWLASAG